MSYMGQKVYFLFFVYKLLTIKIFFLCLLLGAVLYTDIQTIYVSYSKI